MLFFEFTLCSTIILGNVAAILRIGENLEQDFTYFNETEQSIHGPKGEERSQLIPYFL